MPRMGLGDKIGSAVQADERSRPTRARLPSPFGPADAASQNECGMAWHCRFRHLEAGSVRLSDVGAAISRRLGRMPRRQMPMQLIMRSSAAILERCSSPMYFRFGSDTAEQRAKISVRFAAKQSKSRRSAFGQLPTRRLCAPKRTLFMRRLTPKEDV